MIISAVLFSALFIQAGQQTAPPPQEKTSTISPYTERFRRQFNFYPGGKVQVIGGVPGDFKIIGWKRASVMVEAEKIFYQVPQGQGKQLSELFPIRVRYDQTTATIQTVGPAQAGAAVEIHVTLYVPKDRTDLTIQTIKGDLGIGSISGWVEASLAEGSAEIKSMQGYFSLLTQKGDLTVEMDAKRWDGLGFTAVTHKGAVNLRLPAAFSAALQLETNDGNIHIDFPEQLVDGEKVPLAVVTNKNGRTLTATLGAGGAPLRLHTTAGDIHLSANPAP